MSFLDHMPNFVMKLFAVLAIIILGFKIVIPRTSLYYRYWIFYPKIGNYLNERDVVLVSGEHFHLKVRNVNQRLSFTSTDYKVAYADLTGKVTAYKPGTAFIKVTVRGKVLVCRVRVIKLNYTELKLKVGETKHLNVLGCFLLERYQSKDPTVATVSFTGKVRAAAPGRTTIIVYAKGRELACQIFVAE